MAARKTRAKSRPRATPKARARKGATKQELERELRALRAKLKKAAAPRRKTKVAAKPSKRKTVAAKPSRKVVAAKPAKRKVVAAKAVEAKPAKRKVVEAKSAKRKVVEAKPAKRKVAGAKPAKRKVVEAKPVKSSKTSKSGKSSRVAKVGSKAGAKGAIKPALTKEQRYEEMLARRKRERAERLEAKIQQAERIAEKNARELAQLQAIKAARDERLAAKRKGKPSLFHPEDVKKSVSASVDPDKIPWAFPPSKGEKRPRVTLQGESIEQKIEYGEKLIAEVKAKNQKLRREMKRAGVKRGDSPEKKALADDAAEKIRAFFDNVKHEMSLHGLDSRSRVVANRDATVDAEMRIGMKGGADIEDVRAVLLTLEETMGNGIPEIQWISVGFTAAPEVNEPGILKTAREYATYEGEIRFNTRYQEADQLLTGYSFLVAERALTGFVGAYGEKITGILLRTAWSQSGRLFRENDVDIRKTRMEKQRGKLNYSKRKRLPNKK